MIAPTHFADTSALAKLYIQEQGSEVMLRLGRDVQAVRIAVVSLTRVELQSALRRRFRDDDLDQGNFDEAVARIEIHWASRFLVQPITESVLAEAVQLVDRHGLRAYDAVQLASCLVMASHLPRRPVLLASDEELLQAGRAEGLEVLNPEAAA